MTYLEDLAVEIEAAIPVSALPEGPTRSLFLGYAVLARAKGTATQLSDVHDAWVAWMLERGEWHESMVPFDLLDPETQREDVAFVDAIRLVAGRLAGP